MRDKDRQLASQCQLWAKSARDAEAWLQDNRENVGGECDLLCKNMRRAARSFGRLATAASRKMCVGVFGPSQAGKSYLISVLAKDKDGNLVADFMGEQIDFIQQINPQGGKESTGLVTRFTTTPIPGITRDKPVRLRLFSEMDLVRVFANTYYADCDHKDAPDQDALLNTLREIEAIAAPAPVNSLTRDDVEDLREYLQKNFASRARVQLLTRTYWNKAMDLAPRLNLTGRMRLFGLIWDNVPEFDAYFYTLAKNLEDLGNPSEVNCPLEALLPRTESIIDVTLLSPSVQGADKLLELSSLDGKTLSIPRNQVTALTTELTIYMPNEPDAFFAHTDLLDFPGYRSRLKTGNLRETLDKLKESTNPEDAWEKTFFLRGKVAYLFERYCEEQELTSMLLCIGPSNQEVQDLPGAINYWIGLTQGETPQSRAGHEPTLFFVLTKVDMQFSRTRGTEGVAAGQEEANSWDIRLTASLTSFFGAQYEWVDNWDGRPFQNVFLLRNPNFLSEALFSYSEDNRELGIKDEAARSNINRVHNDYLKSELVNRYIANPEEAWQAALKLNDGGVGLLRQKLTPICDPDRKYNQTRDRALETCRKLADRLQLYFRDDDINRRIEQKRQLAQQLMRLLAGAVGRQQFAEILARFLVSDYDLYEMASQCAEIPETTSSSPAPQTVVGGAIDADDLLGDLFGDPSLAAPTSQPQAAAQPEPADAAGTDQIAIFCRQAVDYWFEKVRALSETPFLHRLYQIPAEHFAALASELILGARHARLLEEMIASIRAKSGFRNVTREVTSWRMASEAAYRINSFVSWLGHDARLGQKTHILYNNTPTDLFVPSSLSFGSHGEPLVGDQQTPYDRNYCLDWLKAFHEMVVASVAEPEENFDPHQNSRLGDILSQLNKQV